MKSLKILSLLTVCFETVFGTRWIRRDGWHFEGFDPIDLTVDRHCHHHAKAYLGKAFEDMEKDRHKDEELASVSKFKFSFEN